MEISDADLVKLAAGGDHAAFGQLYDRYAPLVRAICNDTTRNATASDDMAQQVFLRAYEKLGGLKDPSRFAPWLVSMSRNVCREFRRGRFRDRHVLVGLEPLETEPADYEDQDDRVEYLRVAMLKLPEKERLALRAFYLLEQDAEKARQALGVSRSSFYRLLDRGKQNLEKLIREQESHDEVSE